MLQNGIDGFEGGMTAKKYIVITKNSKATATRDLQELQEIGVFAQEGAGRSVRYELVLQDNFDKPIFIDNLLFNIV